MSNPKLNLVTMSRSQASTDREDDDKGKEKRVSPELQFSQFLRNAIDELDGEQKYTVEKSIIYEWDGKYWNPMTFGDVEKEAVGWLAEHEPGKTSAKTATSCASTALMLLPPLPKHDLGKKSVMVPCQNGYLRMFETDSENGGGGKLWAREVLPHDRKFGMTYMIGCDYLDHDATFEKAGEEAPAFQKFLSEVLPDPETRGYVQEFVGYTLLNDCRFEQAQLWLGRGSNGKSTLSNIVQALHRRVAAFAMNSKSQFSLEALAGTSLAVCDEVPRHVDEEQLKMVISGNLCQIEQKYKPTLSFRPTAKWLILGNQVPVIRDSSDGFWRRIDVIPFSAKFDRSEGDPLLGDRIISDELPGVLSWALGGLQRLMERGRFPPPPPEVAAAKSDGQRETNSVLAWWDDVDAELCDALTPRDWVVANYRKWCADNGMAAMGSEKFWGRLAQICGVARFDAALRATINCRQMRVVPLRVPGIEP